MPPLDHPANALLLRWLAPIGVPVPAFLYDWEVDVYRLLAAPDLVARMLALAGVTAYCALHGFPALAADDGQVDVVAAGVSTLVVRWAEPPVDLVQPRARPPEGWSAIDAWADPPGRTPKETEARLAQVVQAARLR